MYTRKKPWKQRGFPRGGLWKNLWRLLKTLEENYKKNSVNKLCKLRFCHAFRLLKNNS